MSRPAAAVVLAAVGLGVSTYLAAYQTGMLGSVWDPVFGAASSRRVLRSPLSRALPIPDALLGALAYAAEVALGVMALRTARRLALVGSAAVAGLMALTSLGLVAFQVFALHHLCLLCLVSALISWLVAALALPEGLAALRDLRQRAARDLADPSGVPATMRQV